MSGLRLLVSLAAATAAGAVVQNALAQDSAFSTAGPSEHSSIKLKLEDFARPHDGGIALPLGIDYSRQTKSVVMPLDLKREWAVGVNLDIGDAAKFNSESGLGVELKKTPGVVFQRNF